MNDARNNELEVLRNEFETMVQKILKVPINGCSTSAGIAKGSAASFHYYLSEFNKDYVNSDYLLPETKRVLHFTSLKALFSIINEGAVRLYSLSNSTDPYEYSYVAENLFNIYCHFEFNEASFTDYLTIQKDKSFILSCTEVDEINNPAFWEEFGNGGKGVALEFELLNKPKDWSNFYYSKVQYGKAHSVFSEFIRKWRGLFDSNPGIKYSIDMSQLISFHKRENPYSWQNEIRLLTQPFIFGNFKETFQQCVFRDVQMHIPNKGVKYFKLPLCDKTGGFINDQWSNLSLNYVSYVPRLRLSNIYFGREVYRENNNFNTFGHDLRLYIQKKMNYLLPDLHLNKM